MENDVMKYANALPSLSKFQIGQEIAQADDHAQAITDRSVDDVVTVTGELDTLRDTGRCCNYEDWWIFEG
jgi:hypothetical protein